jgi:transposase
MTDIYFFLSFILIEITMRSNKIDTIKFTIYELINKIVNTMKTDTRGSKPKYDNKLFIYAFIKRLTSGNSWKELENEFKISDTHLNRVFIAWCDNNIFRKAHELFLKTYKCYIDNDEVYIDSTILLNKYGYRDTTGINTYEAKKHRSNKLSCIVSKNGIPLGIKLTNSQTHDIKILLDTLPQKTYFSTLIGDKGYISKSIKQKLKRNRKINLITEYRKNQKEKQPIDTKSRITIEHFNSLIKQYRCINTRYDKNIETYEGIIYLGCLYRSFNIVFNIFYNL